MTQHYFAVPHDHTVIHLPFLHFLTHTMYVYNRLMVTGHASLVQQAIKGFPPTPETSNMKRPMPCKTEIKTENRNRTSSNPKPSPESFPKPRINRRVYFLEKAARARKTAYLSANDVNDRNTTKSHQKFSEPNPTSTPTKPLSLAHPISQTKPLSLEQPISPNSLNTIVEQHAQTNEEAHKVSQDAIDPDTQAYSDDDLIDIRDENGTSLLLPNAKAETTSSHPPSCNASESVPPHVQTNSLTSAETASPDQAKAPSISNPPETNNPLLPLAILTNPYSCTCKQIYRG